MQGTSGAGALLAGTAPLVRRTGDPDLPVEGVAGRVDAPHTWLRVGVATNGQASRQWCRWPLPVHRVDVGVNTVRATRRVSREVERASGRMDGQGRQGTRRMGVPVGS